MCSDCAEQNVESVVVDTLVSNNLDGSAGMDVGTCGLLNCRSRQNRKSQETKLKTSQERSRVDEEKFSASSGI